jgi:integrase
LKANAGYLRVTWKGQKPVPRKELNQRVVETLKPDPSKTIEKPDHLYPSLRLIVQPTGSRAFAVRRKLHGKPIKITLEDVGLDLKAARERTRAVLAEIAAGKDPRASRQKAKVTTLSVAAELYLKATRSQVRAKTQVERERHLRRDWKDFHHRPIAEIGKGEVAARLLVMKDEYGFIAARRSRTTLYNLFEWAADPAHNLVDVNVVAATRRTLKGHEPTRDRVLTPEERRAIWAATVGADDYDVIVRLLLLTGQRREEVAAMRWSELDLANAKWELPRARTKNKLPHIVPLVPQVLALLEARERKEGRDFVFGDGDGGFSGWSRSKRRLVKKSGVLDAECYAVRRLGRALRPGEKPNAADKRHGWIVHDLRRTVITDMNDELGIQPHVVEAIVNHVTGEAKKGTAGRYNHARYMKERRTALQAWVDHVLGTPADNLLRIQKQAS